MSLNFESIPPEIWVSNIFPKLKPKRLIICSLVCKIFEKYASDQFLWKDEVRKRFPLALEQAEVLFPIGKNLFYTTAYT